jgi:hypothetical protein
MATTTNPPSPTTGERGRGEGEDPHWLGSLPHTSNPSPRKRGEGRKTDKP